MDDVKLQQFVDHCWDDEIVPTLTDYISIPNKSPAFDPDWLANGHMEEAIRLFAGWARPKVAGIVGASVEVVRLPGLTPLILIEIPATHKDPQAHKDLGAGEDTVLLYGHLDKQPEMVGWAEGFGPWVPRLVDGKLYGRGGADDGYAMFGALSAILALRDQGIAHARCVIIIEACEESGSYDLPHYVDHLEARIGGPSLVICLDSGCGDYERLWLTTSLRGMMAGSLDVQVLDEGVHSGDASGVVPTSFRIARALLSRLEDENTGEIMPSELYIQIPPERMAQARLVAEVLGDELYTKFPFSKGMSPVSNDLVELVLNRTWRPQLAITGAEGLPALRNAGNVLLPSCAMKLSLRLPPSLDAAKAGVIVKKLLEDEPPYGASVRFTVDQVGTGWNAPHLSPWLEKAVADASAAAFGLPPAYTGEGGSIPFMAMLGEKFPQAQFVVTGVLGPHSNAHGPNEFLHISMGKRLSAAIAHILKAHAAR